MRLHSVLDSNMKDKVSRTDTRCYMTCTEACEELVKVKLGRDVAFSHDEHV